MKFRHLFAIIICCWASLQGTSYSQEYKISGKVTDSKTGMAIPNANISLFGKQTGTTSGSDGTFIVVSDTLPVNIIVSHVNYKTHRLWLETLSGPVTIMMDPSVQLLKEVEITDKNEPYPFFKDKRYAVLDYAVDRGLIYLLIYKYRLSRSELLCESFYGDTLAPPLPLSFKPTTLFQDCLGSIHILSKDSIYQIYLGKDSLQLIYHYGIEKYHTNLEKCLASTESRLYFSNTYECDLAVNFYFIDRKNYRKQSIGSIRDEKKIKLLHNNPMDYYYANMTSFPETFQGMIDWMWVHRILYTPNSSTLKKIGDTLCVFSTVDGTIQLMDLEGQVLSEKTMTLVEKAVGDWTREIYVDQATKTAYTACNKYGKVSLYKIDIPTGHMQYILNFSHPFPEKIQVYDGHLFYLYDVPGETDNKHLFKQKI